MISGQLIVFNGCNLLCICSDQLLQTTSSHITRESLKWSVDLDLQALTSCQPSLQLRLQLQLQLISDCVDRVIHSQDSIHVDVWVEAAMRCSLWAFAAVYCSLCQWMQAMVVYYSLWPLVIVYCKSIAFGGSVLQCMLRVFVVVYYSLWPLVVVVYCSLWPLVKVFGLQYCSELQSVACSSNNNDWPSLIVLSLDLQRDIEIGLMIHISSYH